MITIRYTLNEKSNGVAIPDFEVDSIIKSTIRLNKNGLNPKITTTTSNLIFALRLSIIKKEIKLNDIKFEYEDKNGEVENIEAGSFGEIGSSHDGLFANFEMIITDKILKEQMEILTKEKNE